MRKERKVGRNEGRKENLPLYVHKWKFKPFYHSRLSLRLRNVPVSPMRSSIPWWLPFQTHLRGLLMLLRASPNTQMLRFLPQNAHSPFCRTNFMLTCWSWGAASCSPPPPARPTRLSTSGCCLPQGSPHSFSIRPGHKALQEEIAESPA